MEYTTIKAAYVLALVAGLAACATPPAPVAAGTDMAPYGNLTSGEKFGAKVGQSSTEAERVLLAQGFGLVGVVTCGGETKMLLGCLPQAQYLAFQPVQNGRKGHIYLRIENDHVAQIGWSLHAVATLEG